MTIHQCDKCKKEISIEQKRFFSHRIYFSEGFFDFLYNPKSFNYNKRYELCKDCTEKLIAFLEDDKHE